jgi:hypothetical protein
MTDPIEHLPVLVIHGASFSDSTVSPVKFSQLLGHHTHGGESRPRRLGVSRVGVAGAGRAARPW